MLQIFAQLSMVLVSMSPALQPVSRGDLCVTKGQIETGKGPHLLVSVPEMRAVVRHTTPPSASVAFTYRGPSRETKALGSGAVRRQIGLKLRAENGCNLVYAVWRIAPKVGTGRLGEAQSRAIDTCPVWDARLPECPAAGLEAASPTRARRSPRDARRLGRNTADRPGRWSTGLVW